MEVGDVEVARTVEGHAVGGVESLGAIDVGRDDSGERHLGDGVGVGVGDVEVAIVVGRVGG